MNDHSEPIQILRHRAAIRRTEPSLPLKCLLRDNLLDKRTSFFDYGCGHGDDLAHVREYGISGEGWDPAYRPETMLKPADVVNLGYVINVIEDIDERKQTSLTAWQLAKQVLVVTARISVSESGAGDMEFGDGVLTRLQTFQKYYTQLELRMFLNEVLSTEVYPAAPGVFYAFKDERLKQSFLASRCRRRVTRPRRKIAEIEFDRHRDLLDSLIEVAADLGRMPYEDEFDRTTEVQQIFGTFKRAFKLIRKVTGANPWEELRRERVENLRVYLALAQFPKRPKFSQVPARIQRE